MSLLLSVNAKASELADMGSPSAPRIVSFIGDFENDGRTVRAGLSAAGCLDDGRYSHDTLTCAGTTRRVVINTDERAERNLVVSEAADRPVEKVNERFAGATQRNAGRRPEYRCTSAVVETQSRHVTEPRNNFRFHLRSRFDMQS